MDSLRNPGQPPEDLLDTLTFKRADGREVSLRDFPMAELLRLGETLRAEEIVMRVPDGRCVTVLLNATPILSDDGSVESMIVTMQDMADVEEQERLRAEFLAMVSHELRTPLTSIMGSVTALMQPGQDLDPAVVRQFVRIIGGPVRAHERPGRRPAGRGAHRDGNAAGQPGARRRGRAGGSGKERLRQRRGQEHPRHRRRAEPASRHGGQAAHRPGAGEPPVQRNPQLPRVVGHQGERGAGRRSRGVLGVRPGARHPGGQPSRPVPQVLQGAVRGAGRGHGPGPRHLQGHRGGARGPHLGRERRAGSGGVLQLHAPVGRDAGGAVGAAPPVSTRESREVEERVRVLAVDDDPHDLRYVRDTLVRSGYDPVVTGEPDEALRLLEDERPELVLLDLMLPGKDGIELMKDILDLADVPVIFLSVYGREEVIAKAFDMGPQTTWSSPSRRRSFRRGSGRPCGDG